MLKQVDEVAGSLPIPAKACHVSLRNKCYFYQNDLGVVCKGMLLFLVKNDI